MQLTLNFALNFERFNNRPEVNSRPIIDNENKLATVSHHGKVNNQLNITRVDERYRKVRRLERMLKEEEREGKLCLRC
jgi:hypothetical protein